MNEEELKAFEAEINAFVGQVVYPTTPAEDDVNEAMIRQWAEILGEANPAYLDEDWAAKSSRGHVISPPAMMYVWGQEGFQVTKGRAPNAMSNLVATFNKYGFTGVLGTNVKQEYFKESELGDNISVHMIIDSISERKMTARGPGYFFETLSTFTDQHGDTVGTQRFKVLKFIPQEQPAAAASDDGKLEVPTRIASVRGHDNGWWWDAVDDGKVLIQRCKNCQTLRHPPRPMCAQCQSLEWDFVVSSGKGSVHTFTVIHHPQFPGYDFPIIAALIDLEEGTRLMSNVVECKPEDVSIGMAVQGFVQEGDDGLKLPVFRPA